MNDFTNVLKQSMINYFDLLHKVGYVSNCKVKGLILLSFLEQFLNEYNGYITEEDYNLIDNIVTCLMRNNCLVPYSKYRLLKHPVSSDGSQDVYRVTEYNVDRSSQNGILRIPVQEYT